MRGGRAAAAAIEKPPENVFFRATDTQTQLFEAVFGGIDRYILFGGGVGGGKTRGALMALILACLRYPGMRAAIVRDTFKNIVGTVYPAFNQIRPPGMFDEIHQTHHLVNAKNGSQLIFLAEDYENDKTLENWKSHEFNMIWLEEADKLRRQTFIKAIERVGRWQLPKGPTPPPVIIVTCNPCTGWIKEIWYDRWRNGTLKSPYRFIPSLTRDNPHLQASYLEGLEENRKVDEAYYKRFVEGSWEVLDQPRQLIKETWLTLATQRIPDPVSDEEQALGIDIARYGGDSNVMAHMRGNQLVALIGWGGSSTLESARKIADYARAHRIPYRNIRIDVMGGIGVGVVDALRETHYMAVSEYVGGARPSGKNKTHRFERVRSEAYWNLREALDPETTSPWQLSISPEVLRTDLGRRLVNDLTIIEYDVSSDRLVTIQSKEVVRSKLGRSPDAGDALAMACYRTDSSTFNFLQKINTW